MMKKATLILVLTAVAAGALIWALARDQEAMPDQGQLDESAISEADLTWKPAAFSAQRGVVRCDTRPPQGSGLFHSKETQACRALHQLIPLLRKPEPRSCKTKSESFATARLRIRIGSREIQRVFRNDSCPARAADFRRAQPLWDVLGLSQGQKPRVYEIKTIPPPKDLKPPAESPGPPDFSEANRLREAPPAAWCHEAHKYPGLAECLQERR